MPVERYGQPFNTDMGNWNTNPILNAFQNYGSSINSATMAAASAARAAGDNAPAWRSGGGQPAGFHGFQQTGQNQSAPPAAPPASAAPANTRGLNQALFRDQVANQEYAFQHLWPQQQQQAGLLANVLGSIFGGGGFGGRPYQFEQQYGAPKPYPPQPAASPLAHAFTRF